MDKSCRPVHFFFRSVFDRHRSPSTVFHPIESPRRGGDENGPRMENDRQRMPRYRGGRIKREWIFEIMITLIIDSVLISLLFALPSPFLSFSNSRRIDRRETRVERERGKGDGSFGRSADRSFVSDGFWRRLYAVQATQSWRGLEVGAPWKGAWGREKSTMLILT